MCSRNFEVLVRSLAKLHTSDLLNVLLVYNHITRSTKQGPLKIALARNTRKKFLVKHRGSQLFGSLQENNLVPLEKQSLKDTQFLKWYIA